MGSRDERVQGTSVVGVCVADLIWASYERTDLLVGIVSQCPEQGDQYALAPFRRPAKGLSVSGRQAWATRVAVS